MQSYDVRVNDTEEKVSLQYQENLTLSEGGRDDIQLQRLGKKPVLKASKIGHDHQSSTCSILFSVTGVSSRFLALPVRSSGPGKGYLRNNHRKSTILHLC
jgi:hypothetical protein